AVRSAISRISTRTTTISIPTTSNTNTPFTSRERRKSGMTLKRSILLLSTLLLSGCVHYPVNAPVRNADPQSGYRFQTVAQTNSDDLLLMLAFSGGGTRAAALSYGVLEELRKTQVGPPESEHRLLDDVGLISSVSGGSFTAAYYALWGDRIFSEFEP